MEAFLAFLASPAVSWTLLTTGGIALVVVWVLLSLAFLLLADRKIWAGVQMRKGPNVVGPFGLLQSFADFGKFVLKEIIIPAGADKVVFLLAPLLSLVLAFVGWAVVPFAPGWVVSNLNVGILYLLAMIITGAKMIFFRPWPPNTFQFQIQPDCCSTMELRFKVLAISRTVMMIRPIDTSYDTICAAERSAPRNGYFEFEAQPPMMMP